MTEPNPGDGGSQLDRSPTPAAAAPSEVAGPAKASGATAGRPAWAVFVGVAVGVLVLDQLSKAWVVASIEQGTAIRVVGDLVRLIHSRNNGALFGLFGSSAPILAVASIVVIALIVGYHARAGRNLLLSIALGLLLGGALGNLLDRLRLGYVVDWVDAGIGTLRFFTFNIGDAAISTAILLLLAIALIPNLGTRPIDG